MGMALAHGAVSGLALFYALLAYSSLHRYGLNEQALEYKIQALQSLSASVTDKPLIPAEGAQHVAASMLLGAFEVSCTKFPSKYPGIMSLTLLVDATTFGRIG